MESYLWKRLERWSERWRGRAAELEAHPITGQQPNEESRLGSALFNSIGSAQAWVLDEPRRRRLVALCVDDWCREAWSYEQPTVWVVEATNGGWLYATTFRVGTYTARTLAELKKKLAQYAEGSVFRWCPDAANPFDTFSPGQREEMFQELSIHLAKTHSSLQPYSEEKFAPGAATK